MIQTTKLTTVAALVTLYSVFPAQAGPTPIAQTPEPAPCGDWCDTLKGIGTVYKDGDGFFNEVKFFGRYQWQSAYIDGNDVNGDNFNETFSTHRRFRLGAQVKFADYFKLKANVNLVQDGRHAGLDLNWGLPDIGSPFDEAKITFDAGKAFGTGPFDALSFTYGRQKLKMSQEAHTSSKKIVTIERSALANKIYASARPVGLTMDYKKGDWKGAFAIFDTARYLDDDFDSVVGKWNNGLSYYASLTRNFQDDSALIVDFIYNDQDEELFVPQTTYEWATSIAYTGNCDKWGYTVNAIVGDNGEGILGSISPDRQGLFYGAIFTGTYWIAEDTLELVGQYQWQGSEEDEGIRTNSRYFRANKHDGDMNSGRGDSHHSLYAGLNWYLCGHNAKIMTGVEYQTIDTPDGDADATTLLLAYRMYF